MLKSEIIQQYTNEATKSILEYLHQIKEDLKAEIINNIGSSASDKVYSEDQVLKLTVDVISVVIDSLYVEATSKAKTLDTKEAVDGALKKIDEVYKPKTERRKHRKTLTK